MPFSDLEDASGTMLLLVLCSAPAEVYRPSYALPDDRFRVVVVESLERCLQLLEELPYLPDCMVVEGDDLSGGPAAANKVVTAIRRRLGPADLPLLRVVRSGVCLGPGGWARQAQQQPQQQRHRPPLGSDPHRASADALLGLAGGGDTLFAPFDPEELDALVTARVALRRLHQQRAAAHATLAVLRHLLPAPAFADLTHGTPWGARTHSDVAVLSAALVDPHAAAAAMAMAPAAAAAPPPSQHVSGSAAVTAAAGAVPAALVAALHDLLAAFDGLCDMHGVSKIGMLGGEYVAASGLPGSSPDHLERLMRVAAGMVAAAEALQEQAAAAGAPALEVQIGVHTGTCVSCVVGRTRPSFTLLGEAPAVASELRSAGHPNTVHVSSAVRERLQSRQGAGFGPGDPSPPGGGEAGAGADGGGGGGGGRPLEFTFVAAATSRALGLAEAGVGGRSGLGHARTYFAQVGNWRAALATTSPSAGGGSALARGPPTTARRVVHRSTHSRRALMAAAAAASAAAAAATQAAAGPGPSAVAAAEAAQAAAATGRAGASPHRLPARAFSASSIEVGHAAAAGNDGAAGGASQSPTLQGPGAAAAAAEYGAVAAALAPHRHRHGHGHGHRHLNPGSAAAAATAGLQQQQAAADGGAGSGYGGGGGAAAAATAFPNPPKRAPPTRGLSNLSNVTSLFAPSEWTHASSGITGDGTGTAFGTGTGTATGSVATQGSDSMPLASQRGGGGGGGGGGGAWGGGGGGGLDPRLALQYAAAAVPPAGGGSTGGGAGGDRAAAAAAALPSPFLTPLQLQQLQQYPPLLQHQLQLLQQQFLQQQQHQHHHQHHHQQQQPESRRPSHSVGALGGVPYAYPSGALPTVNEDLSGPGGVSGSLGGFTAALAAHHLSQSGVSLQSTRLHSAGPSERLGGGGGGVYGGGGGGGGAYSSASGLSVVKLLAGALASADGIGGGGLHGMHAASGRRSTDAVADAAGRLAAVVGGCPTVGVIVGDADGGDAGVAALTSSDSQVGHDVMLGGGGSTAGVGSGSGPYMIYTNLTNLTSNSEAGRQGSGAGRPLMPMGDIASGGGGGGVDGGGAGTSGGGRDTVAEGRRDVARGGLPFPHGISHAELLTLLASPSVSPAAAGGGGGACGDGGAGGGAAAAALTAGAVAKMYNAATGSEGRATEPVPEMTLTGTTDRAVPSAGVPVGKPRADAVNAGPAAPVASSPAGAYMSPLRAPVVPRAPKHRLSNPAAPASDVDREGNAVAAGPAPPTPSAAPVAGASVAAAAAVPPAVVRTIAPPQRAAPEPYGAPPSAAAAVVGAYDVLKASASTEGSCLLSNVPLPSNASISAAELAALIQVAGRSVGGNGNSGSSISFPHLTELASATLRDVVPLRAQGSSVSVGSYGLLSQLQLFTASVDNGNSNMEAISASLDSDAELPASLRGGLAGLAGPPPAANAAAAAAPAAPGISPAAAAAAAAAATVALISARRRSADMQRALFTAAAARSSMQAPPPGAAAAPPRAPDVPPLAAAQPVQGRDAGAAAGAGAASSSSSAAAAAAAGVETKHGGAAGEAAVEARIWTAAGPTCEGVAVASGGAVSAAGASAALPPAAAGVVSGSADAGIAEWRGPGVGVGSSMGEKETTAAAPGGKGRARPAAGPLGGLSSLSTVPDDGTPPTSSGLHDNLNNSRTGDALTLASGPHLALIASGATNAAATPASAIAPLSSLASTTNNNDKVNSNHPASGAHLAAADAPSSAAAYGGDLSGTMGRFRGQVNVASAAPPPPPQRRQRQHQAEPMNGQEALDAVREVVNRGGGGPSCRVSRGEPGSSGGGGGGSAVVMVVLGLSGADAGAAAAAAAAGGGDARRLAAGGGGVDTTHGDADILSSEASGISSGSMAAAAEAQGWSPRGAGGGRRHSGSFTTMNRCVSGSQLSYGAGSVASAAPAVPRAPHLAVSCHGGAAALPAGVGAAAAAAALHEAGGAGGGVHNLLLSSSMGEALPYGSSADIGTSRTDGSAVGALTASASALMTTQQSLTAVSEGGGGGAATGPDGAASGCLGSAGATASPAAGSGGGDSTLVRSTGSLVAEFFRRRSHKARKQQAGQAAAPRPLTAAVPPPPQPQPELRAALSTAVWQTSSLYSVSDRTAAIEGAAAAPTARGAVEAAALGSGPDPWASGPGAQRQNQLSSPQLGGTDLRLHSGSTQTGGLSSGNGGLSGMLKSLSFGKRRGGTGARPPGV